MILLLISYHKCGSCFGLPDFCWGHFLLIFSRFWGVVLNFLLLSFLMRLFIVSLVVKLFFASQFVGLLVFHLPTRLYVFSLDIDRFALLVVGCQLLIALHFELLVIELVHFFELLLVDLFLLFSQLLPFDGSQSGHFGKVKRRILCQDLISLISHEQGKCVTGSLAFLRVGWL